ncbi:MULTISPECIES: hypothetical protein [Streptomyces]|uniref:hypothetical protein n=1 Tax=Streptomyces TaxID=1883 RepID=UPI000720B331|nr:hypothetical protein [Streptomyces sp. FR-008]ALM38214.1 LigA protein [Streptomyces sp. FR-008]KAF0795856.1 hypothetical protein P405_00410 [Streptomyces sp. FR-008]
MTRIPDAVAVASLDTHRLIVAVPNDGPAEVACNLPRPAASNILRQLADALAGPAGRCDTAVATGHPCPVHDAPTVDDQALAEADPLTADDVRAALDFNADDRDPVLATLRDVLLDTTAPRNPEQALAAARILLTAHARQVAALVEAHYRDTRTRFGLNRSSRGLLTGYEGARKIVTAYADGLADEQALAEAAEREQAKP